MHHCNAKRNGYAEEILAAHEPLPHALSIGELKEATHMGSINYDTHMNRATQHHVPVSLAHTVTTETSRNDDIWLSIHVRHSRTPLHSRTAWFVTIIDNAWSNDRNRFREGTRGDDQYCELHEPRRFDIELPCKPPVRENTVLSALCATNYDVNRCASTTILCTHAEFHRAAE